MGSALHFAPDAAPARFAGMRSWFEDFELDAEAFELRRAGEPVRLEPQVFALLACLAGGTASTEVLDELYSFAQPTRFVPRPVIARPSRAVRQLRLRRRPMAVAFSSMSPPPSTH
jgi:hypothetical protein